MLEIQAGLFEQRRFFLIRSGYLDGEDWSQMLNAAGDRTDIGTTPGWYMQGGARCYRRDQR